MAAPAVWLRRHPRLLVATLLLFTLATWALGAWLIWFAFDVTVRLPGGDALRGIGDMAQATTIYDSRDRPVFTIFREQRIEVPLSRVSPHLVRAVIAVEDQRFFEHRGVDVIRVLAAALVNLREGRRAQGGSTITQQLARQSFLSRDKTFRRKLKEIILAARIEREYSKEQILELYLNKVYFGDGLYGAEAAARGFFGKPAAELDLAEAALLAGLIRSPSTYAPTVDLERAIERRGVVLRAMLETGAIDRARYDAARTARVRLRNSLQRDERFGLYFKEQVRRELVERFGWQRVYQGGLQVYTTLDTELQQAAERIVEEGLREIESRRGYAHPRRGETPPGTPDYLQAALIALDPRTGHVRAMVGGRDFTESRFNRATQARRQPGSAFKPFVFAAALEAGYTPATIIDHLDDPLLTAEGEWMPEDDHSTARAMTLRTALRTSSNRAAVQLLRRIGIPRAVACAERLAIGRPPSVPSIALGTAEVSLAALTAAYAAFAAGGIVRPPVFIRRVVDADGRVLYDSGPSPGRRAVSEETAFLMATMLADVVNSGTAWRARREGFWLPAAGKTGTTNDFMDAWFVGFTPSLAAGVWVGFDQPRTIIPNGYAADLAVPMWARFMKTATRGARPEWIPRPRNVVAVNICRASGLLPNTGCGSAPVLLDTGAVETRSLIYTEYFVRGSEPRDLCPLHPAPSLLDRLVGLFGGRDEPPVRADEIGLPLGGVQPPPAAAAEPGSSSPPVAGQAPAPKPEQPERRKRGFWSRLFGLGRDEDREKEKEERQPDQGPPKKPKR
ncbi:MAG TPA: PBP1A family penicillin-binding protein [Vicinamibacterales bacterium]|nr:PBP1A family penicillin-binding protein [Vicinamibacterales bacterium]